MTPKTYGETYTLCRKALRPECLKELTFFRLPAEGIAIQLHTVGALEESLLRVLALSAHIESADIATSVRVGLFV